MGSHLGCARSRCATRSRSIRTRSSTLRSMRSRAAGVRLRLHTWFAGVGMADGAIDAVLVESKKGREAILPRVVIDTSGDGDVFVAAGADYEQVTIPPHLWFRAGGVTGRPGPFVFDTVDPGRVLVPWGPHRGPRRPVRPRRHDPGRAGVPRRGARAFARMRASDPAFANAWLDDYARMIGITESRRLVGDHVLAKEEGDVVFADTIARTGHWTKRDVVYHVPYRCLTTPAAANLLVAGRCISATRYVHQATKEIPAAMATGEAAGVAAAMAAANGSGVREVDVAVLRSSLHRGRGRHRAGPVSSGANGSPPLRGDLRAHPRRRFRQLVLAPRRAEARGARSRGRHARPAVSRRPRRARRLRPGHARHDRQGDAISSSSPSRSVRSPEPSCATAFRSPCSSSFAAMVPRPASQRGSGGPPRDMCSRIRSTRPTSSRTTCPPTWRPSRRCTSARSRARRSTSPGRSTRGRTSRTRFLLCRDDRFFPADFQRRVVRERLGIVPDEMPGGHLPALGHPDELVARLEAYRDDRSP